MALAHSVVGTGENTVVLLHGFLGAGRNLRTLALRWAEVDPSKRLVLVDLPGHGESPPVEENETLQSMARKVMETAGGAPSHWVGHSLGGRVALAALDVDASAVRSVCMLDITPSAIPSETSQSGAVLQVLRRAPATAASRAELRQFLIGNGLPAPIADWLLTNAVSSNGGVRWRFDREALQRLQLRVNAQDLWPVVERKARQVQCVRGRRSVYVPAADVERFERLGVPVREVEAGHYVHVEALEPLLRGLVDWAR